jgi:hypothetical protein
LKFSIVKNSSSQSRTDVTNIAARAQALAEPGAVVVTARVQRQVAGLFVAEERGSHELKGVPEPVTLFRIIRASGGGRRSGMRQLTPFARPASALSPSWTSRHAPEIRKGRRLSVSLSRTLTDWSVCVRRRSASLR